MPFAFVPAPRTVRRLRAVLRYCRTQQSLVHQEQIQQSAGHKQAMGILVQSAIAHLDEAELELHPGKDMARRRRMWEWTTYLARLMHLQIPLLPGVLGRTWRVDSRRIHDRPIVPVLRRNPFCCKP